MWRPLLASAGLVAALGCDDACVPTPTTICLGDEDPLRFVDDPPQGLRAEPPIAIIPAGLVSCLTLVEETDAGRLEVDPDRVTLTAVDPEIARAALPGDCPGLGVIGVGPGDSTLVARRGTDEATVQVRVTREAVTLHGTPASLRAGEVRPWRCGDAACPTLTRPSRPVPDRLRLLPRGLEVVSDAPDVVEIVSSATSGALEIVARRPGTVTIRGTYALHEGLYPLRPTILTVE